MFCAIAPCSCESCSSADVERIHAAFEAKDIKSKLLQVTHGFHSSQIEPALAQLRTVAEGLSPRPLPTDMSIVSNVTGTAMTSVPTAEYWVQHARGTVHFAGGIETAILQLGVNMFVEVSVLTLDS